MITYERVTTIVAGLSAEDLGRFIDNAWVRPDSAPGQYRFQEIDVARLRLILQLRDELGVEEATMPVVLSLLDQLYETRRQMRRLCNVMETTLPAELRLRLFEELGGR